MNIAHLFSKSKPYLFLSILAVVSGLISNSINKRGIPLIYEAVSLQAGMTVTHLEAKAFFDNKEAQFVDAREEGEYLIEHIPGALNIPFNANLQTKQQLFNKLSKDSNVIVYCMDPICNAAERISGEMRFGGFKSVVLMSDGLEAWIAADFPLELYDH